VDSYDNDYDETPERAPGSSVFGDDASYGSGASVFGDDDSPQLGDHQEEAASVFDAPGDSVFADEPPAQQSVFGDTPAPSASVFGDDGDDHEVVEIADESAALEADPWGDGGEPTAVVTVDDWDTGSDNTVALDVDTPERDDDLDAWSGLGGSPQWEAEQPQVEVAAAQPEAWDPGPVPEVDDPAMVQIESSERFFTYDDESAYADDGFVDDTPSSGRDMQSAAITGVALLAIALVAISIGPAVALALIVLVVALSAGELFNALRVAGYQPATLLGLAASIAMPLAVYWRGEQAVPLILGLSVIFGLLWFLVGVSTELPVMNLGVTLLGIVYVGVLGSFGAAMLEMGNRLGGGNGTGLLLAAIVVTIAYDIGAFFAGTSFGRTPLTSVSPNKTVEGLIGGSIASFVAAIVFFGVIKQIEPWDAQGGLLDAAFLGLVGAIMAPLGDLGESLVKRDLGIKDMGSVLPGHGGFLDRFDALLFVLPAVYFLAQAVLY
jgi:CDP-diglyceride synthetase